MNIISIDLEMNQPSGKIIQLGYVIANAKTQKILVRETVYVDPREELSPEITLLTGITEMDIKSQGGSLRDAYDKMVSDMNAFECNKHAIQWGLDHDELRVQLNLSWEEYVFRRRGHDIKTFYQMWAIVTPQGRTIAGLERALRNLGMEFDGTPHQAEDDAYNTLCVFFELSDKLKKFDSILKVIQG